MNSADTAYEVASDWAAAWNGTDPSRLAELFAEDGTYTDLAAEKIFAGHLAIAGFKSGSDAMIVNIFIEVLNSFGDGEQVAIESLYSGHFRGAPQPFSVRGTTTLRLREGLIVTNVDNYNLAAVLAQSGLPSGWTPSAT